MIWMHHYFVDGIEIYTPTPSILLSPLKVSSGFALTLLRSALSSFTPPCSPHRELNSGRGEERKTEQSDSADPLECTSSCQQQ